VKIKEKLRQAKISKTFIDNSEYFKKNRNSQSFGGLLVNDKVS